MGLDLYIFRECRTCGKMNQFEIYEGNESVPFNFHNKEMWALLNKIEKEAIAELREEFHNLTINERAENFDEMNTHGLIHSDYEEDFYVAANMKFIDDGAYRFLKCETCGSIIDVFAVSV